MTTHKTNSHDSLLASLCYKYLPYWPLFAVLAAVFMLLGWGYLRFFSTPKYEITATLIIKDKEKGVNETRMTESMDAFTSNNIVENEIKVIHSRALMKKVVKDLMLYAPVYEEDMLKSVLAYKTSPIIVKVESPAELEPVEKVYFTFDEARKTVRIGNAAYPLSTWVETPYGKLKFYRNKNKSDEPTRPLYFSLVSPKAVTDNLLENLRVETDNKMSTVVNIQLHDPVPERGEAIINTLVQAYHQVALLERNKLAASTLAFVEDRIKLVEGELKNLEDQVVRFKTSESAVDLSEQGKQYLQGVSDNDKRITDINLQLAVLDKVEQYVISKKNAAGIVPSTLGINDPVLSQLLQKLYDSEIEYEKLRRTTAANNPLLTSVSDEINKIRPSVLENIRNQRTSLRARLGQLVSTNARYRSALQSIPEKERDLLEITRQQSIKNSAYSFLLQKREETVLSHAPTVGDSRIVDMAESSVLPATPKPLHVYVIAFVFACVAGFVLVAGKELMSGRLLFRSDIEEHLSTPIVAELTQVKQAKNGLLSEPRDIVVVEQFRQLRATMGLYGRTFSKRTVMVTSSIPGEGKSFVSANLAISLASSGRSVVLLDFDLRNPNTTLEFDLYAKTGLIEYLKGDAEIKESIYSTPVENLAVMPAGISVGDHTELLLNGKLDEAFSFLTDNFDYVIIDTPPVDLVSDGYLLSEYSDITLLVMRHAYTPKRLVQRLAQNNKVKSLNNAAIVFNGLKPRGFIKGQYGYGYGYGYDQRYKDSVYKKRAAPSGV